MFDGPNERVLAAFAHPDDAELACFGTLALLKDRGAEITIVILTDGEGTSALPRAERTEEAVCSARLIGAAVVFAGLGDGKVTYDGKAVAVMERHLGAVAPSILITHFPQTNGRGHQDHEATSSIVTNAGLRHPSVNWVLHAEPPVTSAQFQPNLFIDVTDYFPLKLKALSMFRNESSKAFMQPLAPEMKAMWWAQQALATPSDRRYEAFHLVKGTPDLLGNGCRLRRQRRREASRR